MSEGIEAYSKKKVLSSIGHFFSGKIISAICNFVTTLLIVRNLPSSYYAPYTVILGLAVSLQILSSLSLNIAASRFFPELLVKNAKEQLVKTFNSFLLIRGNALIFSIFLIFIFRKQIFAYLNLPYDSLLFFLIIGTLMFFVLFNFFVKLLEIFLLQKILKWLYITLTLTRISLIAWLIYFGPGLDMTNIFAVEFFSYCIVSLPCLPLLYRFLAKNSTESHNRIENLNKRILPFCIYNYLMQIVLLISSQATDKVILMGNVPMDIMATFGFLASLTSQFERYLPSFLLANLIQPTLMAYYSKNSNIIGLTKVVNTLCKVNFFLTLPLVILSFVAGNSVILFLTDGKYKNFDGIFCILSFRILLWSYTQMLGIITNATEKNRELLLATGIESLFLIPALFALQQFGLLGFLLVRMLGQLFRIYFLINRFRRNNIRIIFDRGFYRFFLAATAAGACIWPFTSASMGLDGILITTFFTIVIFYGTLLLMRPFTDDERAQINNFWGRKLFYW